MKRHRTPLGHRLAIAGRRLRNARRPDVTVLPAPASVIADWDVPVPVRDGTVLRVNIFRARTDDPVPVILCAHPYGQDGIPARRRGVNAQYRAFPQPHPIRFSEWAGTQPWSTGRVGLLGVSDPAISQYGAAAARPAHLAAICPWEGLSDLYRDLA